MNTPKSDSENESLFSPNLGKRYLFNQSFALLTWIAIGTGLLIVVILLLDICGDGLPRLNGQFLSNGPSRRALNAGILPPLVGTIWLLITTAIIAFPVGVGAAIYLEEYAGDNIFTKMIEINIANLAAVPSIIYGLLGLQIFVRILQFITNGRTILTGALTLSLLILPIIIVSTREALRAVPNSLRQAGLALGATKWQVIRIHVFPQALPGILTGTILALSRAIGETAPLIIIGATNFITFLPELSWKGLQSKFTALPIQIFDWVSRPQPQFHTNAAAGIIVLMMVLLVMNTTAIILRNKFQTSRN